MNISDNAKAFVNAECGVRMGSEGDKKELTIIFSLVVRV
jgi:hypothetical protein